MRRTRLLSAAVALVYILTGCSGGDVRETPLTLPESTSTGGAGVSATTTPIGEGGVDRGEGALRLVIDGWSMANIAPGALTWTDAAGKRYPVAVRVATEDDLAALLQDDPAVVAALMARTVTADPSLVCTTDGCRASDSDIALETLLDLTTGPVLGAMFAAWGITDGVHIADLPVGETTLRYGTSSIAVRRSGEVETDDGFGSSTGSDSGIRGIGGAWGRIFNLYPSWLDGSATYSVGAVENVDGSVPEVDPSAFFQGLGARNDAASQLTDTQMTWRTSPTTGCGAGVTCIPGNHRSDVAITHRERVTACSGERRAVVDLVAVDVSVSYPNATHQYGMWDGRRPDGALGKRTNAVWISAAPLVTGKTKQHHAIAYLHDARGVVEFTARISDHAVDTPADVSFRYTAADLGSVLDSTWQPC